METTLKCCPVSLFYLENNILIDYNFSPENDKTSFVSYDNSCQTIVKKTLI